ncbi:MAG: hypothetical protein ACRDFB_08035 [Rhabdochlamydiaceae bacterium]
MVTVINERDYEICPYCNADFTEGNLMYTERGVCNYTYYKKDQKLGWIVDDELDGDNPGETVYECRQCEMTLPTEWQEYYSNNI